MLLGNPICGVAYGVIVSRFFRGRVPYEEAILLDFFPDQYPAYMERTWILIPFVKGADDLVEEMRSE